MKTQVIKSRNIPYVEGKQHTIHVKPDFILVALMMMGIAFMFAKTYMVIIGFVMILLALFAEFIMPDRNLCTFTQEYVVLYNRTQKSECTLVYWEDVVSWQYERHASADILVFFLVDGSSEMQEMYSRRSCVRWLNLFAPGKEVKTVHTRGKAK